MEIATKQEMYSHYHRGGFGNKTRSWETVEAFLKSDYHGKFALRYSGNGGGAWCTYNLTRKDLDGALETWAKQGADRSRIRVSEMAPDDELLIQGELVRDERGLSFFWSREKSPMRVALRNGQESVGLSALLILKHALTPSSMSDIEELWEQFPNSAIELSVFRVCLGDCRGRNTIVWEVRNY